MIAAMPNEQRAIWRNANDARSPGSRLKAVFEEADTARKQIARPTLSLNTHKAYNTTYYA